MIEQSDLSRIARFGVSGLLATGCHVAVAAWAIDYAGWSSMPANTFAFVCATVGSYLLQTLWSFSSRVGRKTLLRFLVVSIGGVTLTALVSHAAERAGIGPWLGIAMVICVVPPFTFVAHRSWTYR
ncbi:GtrA family protein [Trinickia sp. LjRoot230]|uniref:GtrA family protein n=1 Tax=Trinickia sp. LjRoot230 TaxID=3342288 RepID=UPI003ECD1A40